MSPASRSPFAPGTSPRTALAVAISAVLGLLGGRSELRAGDLLRGGAPAGARPGSAGVNVGNPAQQRSAGAAARDALARTSQTVTALQAMQKQARDAAGRGPGKVGNLPVVPNGLVIGGLQRASGGAWNGARDPTQTVQNGLTNVTIRQLQPQAVLDWTSFNVGQKTSVYFNQQGGTQKDGSNNWIAFNRILDPSGVPSQILGRIRGEGSVYLVNQNGILFGGASQVNLHSFVASTLPLNTNLLSRGLLNNPDAQFLFSALALEAGASGTPAFTPEAPLTASGKVGDITVLPGAVLSSPASDAHVGGRIALLGANVTNAGTIATPDGQTILAAGLQIGFAAHSSKDPSLRGLDVSVGAVQKPGEALYAGTATNRGYISAERGNITVTGREVEQRGALHSTTSVSLNGRIDLLANYHAAPYPRSTAGGAQTEHASFLPRATGTVTLGEGSVTRVLPEWSSEEKVVGLKLALPSQVNLQGHVLHLASNATLLAPGAEVSLLAGQWRYTGGALPTNPFILRGGQIYVDRGAAINVAGSTEVSAPLTENILSVELRGAELADAPLQRDSLFRGTTIQVDVRQSGLYQGRSWVGTPLADASGYVGLVERTVGELTTAGGTVKLRAGGSVVLQPGSTVDVSGGWINFQEGMVQTTRVMSGGRLLDISQATPDLTYQGIYTGTFTRTQAKYGLSETFSHPLALTGARLESGYTFGAAGGSLEITSPSMALDGTLLGRTTAGERQREVLPAAASLALSFTAQQDLAPLYPTYSPTPPTVIFQSGGRQTPVGSFALNAAGESAELPEERRRTVYLSPELFTTSGFGRLSVENSDGHILLPAGTALTLAPGGSLSLDGANITLAGRIVAPGGSLRFRAHDISPAVVVALEASPDSAHTPAPDWTRGRFTLAPGAVLSTAGLLVDDRARGEAAGEQPLMLPGGSISISAFTAELASGSRLDVSGGAHIAPNNRYTYGSAGSISIAAGQAAPVAESAILAAVVGGRLELGAELRGFSGATGGSLSLLAPSVQIGGATTRATTLLLQPEFFQEGGFASCSISGLGERMGVEGEYLPGLLVTRGTLLEPRALTAVAVPRADGSGLELQPLLAAEGQRAPASLALNAVGVRDSFTRLPVVRGDLVFSTGARIETDARAAVTLAGETVTVLGSVNAPGGTITIAGGKDSNALFPDLAQAAKVALPTVYLGAGAELSTAGTVLFTPDARGYRTGLVLPGGRISVSGNVVAATGSVLDVSGTSGRLDLPMATVLAPELMADRPMGGGSFQGVPMLNTEVSSSAGAITLAGAQLLVTDATLRARAGGPMGVGGVLTVSSGLYVPVGDATLPTPLEVTLNVTANQPALAVLGSGVNPIGTALAGFGGETLSGQGYFGADRFAAGGFEALNLQGTVRFQGAVSLAAARELRVADGGVIFADRQVTLVAPHVALGTTFRAPFAPQEAQDPFLQGATPFRFPPTHGSGSLTVLASLIDVGNLSLQNIGSARLLAPGGDIRGNGTLSLAGDLQLLAAQVYPPTATTFTISAADYTADGVARQGSVTILGSGTAALPLSAGGTLNVYASRIWQGGTLRAPLGTINLGWDGTGTTPKDLLTGQAVAATKTLTLAGGSVTSVSSIDPLSGTPVLIPYGLNLNGTSWISPTGVDITAGGVPGRSVNLSAAVLHDQAGSMIDLRGGGDLFAYRWVPGPGGSQDLLANSGAFAVVPSYGASYAPYAPYATGSTTGYLGTDPGYTNGTLRAGDQIYLSGSPGLAAGTYTLLPARYALLPGAFLITPTATRPVGTLALTDGANLVSGHVAQSAYGAAPSLYRTFEVASQETVLKRAEYKVYSANRFLAEGAQRNGLATPRLPQDAGHLVLQATTAMTLRGSVAAQSLAGGRGGLVDISSPVDIVITGDRPSPGTAGKLVLNAGELSQFGAESLLIGGVRTFGSEGVSLSVSTGHLLVDNAGTPLQAPDLILAAREGLTLAAGAVLRQTGSLSAGADALLLGDDAVAGSGDGVLLRLSADPNASLTRAGVSASSEPLLTVGAGVQLTGAGLILDSTAGLLLDPTARLQSRSIALSSGQISVVLPGSTVAPLASGLILTGPALASLSAAQRLALTSYSTLDLYGTGTLAARGQLGLHAAALRGFGEDGGTITIAAPTLTLDNRAGGVAPAAAGAGTSTLRLVGDTVTLGAKTLAVQGFGATEIAAGSGLLVRGTGALAAQGDLLITAPLLTGARAAAYTISGTGALVLAESRGAATIAPGLGASLTLQGASVQAESNVILPSGSLTLHAKAGDLTVGGKLSTAGTTRQFYDLTRFTSGGTIALKADAGSVTVSSGGSVNVSAPGQASAGLVNISAPVGTFLAEGSLLGRGATGGSFALDAATLAGQHLAPLNLLLNEGGFTTARSFRLRTGDLLVDGSAAAHHLAIFTDTGSLLITGTLDASGQTGGRIDLAASGSLTVASGARLTVAGQDFDAAGKGGEMHLTAGAQTYGGINASALLDLQSGATLNLSVAAAGAGSAAQGDFTGTLHLRAPQTAGGADLRVGAIGAEITGASGIVVEGYKLYTPAGGALNAALLNQVKADATAFTAHTGEMTTRLFGAQAGLLPAVSITPGTEIINRHGDLTLGSASAGVAGDWDLSSARFGPKSVPGQLTLRAAGNLVFLNSLSDGFSSSAYTATLLANNPALSANAQSWSYRLAAGADFSAADTQAVLPGAYLAAGSGSLFLGKNVGPTTSNAGANAQTGAVIGTRFQTIRTGSGSIEIATARDLTLRTEFSTIYTAGTRVADSTTIRTTGDFDVPVLVSLGGQGPLGAVQQPLAPPQYSYAGGNVSLAAGGDIHRTTLVNGVAVEDSSRQLPGNWLYRRGYVDPVTGLFGSPGGSAAASATLASTTWWVDFSNFFEGVGALGGGNVSLLAGNDIANVDAVIPTNARMAGRGADGRALAPSQANLVELGGGDLRVRAGNDLNGGVYYVERGRGTLEAGHEIRTNATRSPSLGLLSAEAPLTPETWLPTTLFLGKGSFDVTARGDVLLGPTANVFLLPGGVGNTFWLKSYFSTYGAESAVNVASLGGTITLRTEATAPTEAAARPILQLWEQAQNLLTGGARPSASWYQPWLRLNETSVTPFTTSFGLLPGTLRATAFSGNISLAGDLTLSPSPTGTVELAAAGAINGLQPTGLTNALVAGTTVRAWTASTITLSDADPASLPGVTSPFAYQAVVGTVAATAQATRENFLASLESLFAETGSTTGAASVLQTRQALHDPILLHQDDATPARLYAGSGDISGLTFFSPKATRLLAGRDITDLALYAQNLSADDLSLVAAGRDLVAYQPNSPLRLAALAAGNALDFRSPTLAGDLQISGPGTLAVFTGRHLDLGVGPNNADGTGLGLVSIGNGRNPALPFEGADIIAAAGLGTTWMTVEKTLTPETLAEFFLALREAGRDYATAGNYQAGFEAIAKLFPQAGEAEGDISLTAREIKTRSGGNVTLLAPNGSVLVGFDVAGEQPLEQGLLTEAGGDISIYTHRDVTVGTSRIFTLRGGDEIIWSSTGDIAAGASSKTVQSAPPTRVLVDAQTADVKTDLAGLATGGGIGVLATVANVPAGDVSLIAPAGTVDAGDAGIRASGNVTVAAATVLNAGNIAAAGSTSGAPSAAPASAPSLASVAPPSNPAAASAGAAAEASRQHQPASQSAEEPLSLFTVEVIGYGGPGSTPDAEEEKKRREAATSL